MDRETAEPSVRTMPGPQATAWAAHHRAGAAPSTYVYDFVWDVTGEAVGPFCTDIDGNVLMDFTSHVAAAPLGYNNPKIVDRLREFELVDPLKIAGQDFYVGSPGSVEAPDLPGPTQLQDRLLDCTRQYGMDRVLLSNSGAEAIENAIKICYAKRNGSRAVTFDGAFHGRTLGALSLNRSKAVHRRGYPEIGGVVAAPFCDCTEDEFDDGTCTCGFFRDGSSTLRRKLDPDRGHIPADEVAFVIVEPIQGEGGYRIASDPFMRELRDVCELHDVPLIADEIQSGMGRTGKLWAADSYPIEPDVMVAAKGLRVGATISRSDVFPTEQGRLSTTWGAGDFLAAMQGVLTIDAIREHDLCSNATTRGAQFIELVRDADRPTVVDVRGRGLMLAVEFDTKARRDDVIDRALERGLLTLGCGYKTLRLLPPLDVTEREILLGVDLLLEAIDAAGS